jgi:hypothetical protein
MFLPLTLTLSPQAGRGDLSQCGEGDLSQDWERYFLKPRQ